MMSVRMNYSTSSNSDIRPESPNADVVVKVENTNLAGIQKPTHQLSIASIIKNSQISSFLTFFIPISKSFYYLSLLCILPFGYCLITAVTVIILPFLLVSLLVLRILQFFINVECPAFEKLYLVKFVIRFWVVVELILLLIELGIFIIIPKYVPGIKSVMLVGLLLNDWITLICKLIGLYLLNQFLWGIFGYALYNLIDLDKDDNNVGLVSIVESPYEITGCLLFWYGEYLVMKTFPSLKDEIIFGLHTRTWIEAILLLLIGYNLITLLTYVVPWAIRRYCPGPGDKSYEIIASCLCLDEITKGEFNKRYVVYILKGIRRCIIHILNSLLLMLTWLLYFRPRLSSNGNNHKAKDIVTWTLVSVLVGSCLWLIKTCVLLYWEAHTIYDRLHLKIIDTGEQFYFLVLLSNTHIQEAKKALDLEDSDKSSGSCCGAGAHEIIWFVRKSENKVEYGESRSLVRRELMIDKNGPKASTCAIKQAAHYFLDFEYGLSEESLSTDIKHLLEDANGTVIQKLKQFLHEEGKDFSEDWTQFQELLAKLDPSPEISFPTIKKWMETAHSRCRILSNTINSQKQVAECLNKIMIGAIIVITFIFWLLVTDLATTNVLVLIASPFLALTFIFGDTCKSLFQGLIFIYVVHPFDVGDLCLIDETLMEVKTMGIWCTSFSKVRTIGKHHGIIYPNSQLATKNIVHYKTEFDWSDYVEFNLKSTDKKITKNLKHHIESYLDGEKEKFIQDFHSVVISGVGDDVKIAIHLKYNVNDEGWTYFQCLKEKEKLQSEFVLYIQDLIDQQSSQESEPSATPTINTQDTTEIRSQNMENSL